MNASFQLTIASLFLATLGAAACGGASSTIPDGPGSSSGSSGTSGGSGTGSGDPISPTMTGGTSGSPTKPPATGPTVTLSLRGSTLPVAHPDAFAGETPLSQIIAVKSLLLYKSASDTTPLVVVDLGASPVETDLVTGKTNDIATVPLASLPAGTYTIAKIGAAYVRYSVAARMHNGITVDGHYDDIQALSDNVTIDGKTHARGWYHYAFAVGGTTYGAIEGENAPLPALPSYGGMTLETDGPDAFYAFPMNITIDPTAPNDQRIVCEVNVHESFRWSDQANTDYAVGVFDTTPTTYEPVMSFGASSFTLLLESK